MGDSMITRWIASKYDDDLEGNKLWKKLVEFLQKELKIYQEKSILTKRNWDNTNDMKPDANRKPRHLSFCW